MRTIVKWMTTVTALAFAAGIGMTDARAAETQDDAAALAGGTYEGCPFGAFCIYPQNAGWNNGHPSHVFYSYGAHNLSNQVGQHYIFNNQSDGATARTCTGYNGTGCEGYMGAFTYVDKDLTPINSITLQP